MKCNQARSKRCTSRLNNWQTASSHARFETQTRQVEDATTVQFEDAHKGAKFATDNVVSGTRSETLGLSRRRSNEPELPDSSNWLLISHNYDAVVVCRERERIHPWKLVLAVTVRIVSKRRDNRDRRATIVSVGFAISKGNRGPRERDPLTRERMVNRVEGASISLSDTEEEGRRALFRINFNNFQNLSSFWIRLCNNCQRFVNLSTCNV